MSIRIGIAQMAIVPGDVQANRNKALSLAAEGLRQRADIVLFPEGMNSGYCNGFEALAEPASGPTAAGFQQLLCGSDSLVLCGIVERDGDRLHEAALLVGAGGILAHYRKTHLWWGSPGTERCEVEHLTAGNKLATFDVKGFKSGVMICYDGDFPEMTRSYANLGCTMLFWLNMRPQRGHHEVADLARRNSIILAASCNCGMDEMGRNCSGDSNVTNYDGKLLAEIRNREGLIVADVDPAAVPQARHANAWYVGRRPDLYV